ncbi:helix-turn-helix domain-containing protein [Dysgonomonas sp. HGC4]|uniref:helix-turn-helix domain-containing protein n=1 Tax=Dysgonomonas sp. HGC4 TaxID=1658009 RepID=UPI00068138EB|nr:AraC family transcriptional regulator [Dysgonomonas sp. HGC4]MBD8346729.1 helix-turn-helix transcriptional regulator [Dysgonomonas sp. HGC4]
MRTLHLEKGSFLLNNGAGDDLIIEYIELIENSTWTLSDKYSTMIFVMNGELLFSFNEYKNQLIGEGKALMIPTSYKFSAVTKQNCTLITIKIPESIHFDRSFALESLLSTKSSEYTYNLSYLDINEMLWMYLNNLQSYLTKGIQCAHLLELKIKELFFIFQAFYSKEKLLDFFYLHLSTDISFRDLVYKNYAKAKTAQDLAFLMNYSSSGFHKHFKKVFGMPAYQWILQKRSKIILYEISESKKSFKEISEEYGFNSPAHFNDFCKNKLGSSPGTIRKESLK